LDSGPQAGCKITELGQVMKYLGYPFGRNLKRQQEINFILKKIRKRLRHWSYNLLSMPDKIIVLKHILQAMPVFHVMILKFTQKGYAQLETACRRFLSGITYTRNPKVPFTAWAKIIHPKLLGGLGLIDFKTHSAMLKIGYVSKQLKDSTTEWAAMLLENIKSSFRCGTLKHDLQFWTPWKALMLMPNLKINCGLTQAILSG
jgi:hypothetical protein